MEFTWICLAVSGIIMLSGDIEKILILNILLVIGN